ncbi:unnamed protein product [Arabidopsis thaliana]|uniref:Plant thionin family protein n=3 Tax=Arabidopsis TaxID=3701 RepID=A0A654EI22_ARATH|nr:plant thionin family protein [Arabidopsis thaliana]AEE32918.1 plant thionin family protein [Arabidopsis thaliana]KAG7649477.1 hypothetical protein ISN45_At01g045290 [Arabidopsis thaliana x Arabidopsis arenosa]CAA0291554.1 unnamed protein product [Arabidopsis thaliana]VYS48967.1 unnamed protein product [Arabidopsis thaliana]|eukprot:NP_974016.1 plant thionin family protein [Arabidopsis thaliana]
MVVVLVVMVAMVDDVEGRLSYATCMDLCETKCNFFFTHPEKYCKDKCNRKCRRLQSSQVETIGMRNING